MAVTGLATNVTLIIVIFILSLAQPMAISRASGKGPIKIGCKQFTENIIVAEMMALLLEAEGFSVIRKLNLQGTWVCFTALGSGDIDMYPEY